MKIYTRTEFLKLPANTLYCKWEPCYFGSMEIKASGPDDGWGNDWVTDNFIEFVSKPHDDSGYMFKPGEEFRFEDNQTIRDGLFETEEEKLFAVFDNEDILQIANKLAKCLTPSNPATK